MSSTSPTKLQATTQDLDTPEGVLNGIRDALESRGIFHMANGRDIGLLLDYAGFNFTVHLARQAAWSEKTFGPGSRAQGVVDHIRKELCKIEADPDDLKEWIDVVILALDGAWRSGATPAEIIAALVAKQTKNEGRAWPDWRTADPGKAIKHVREPTEYNGTCAYPDEN